MNTGADPRRNAWSGIHTRLSAEIISRQQQVDGVLIWDMACGPIERPCPTLENDSTRATELGPFVLPPPCIYPTTATVPSVRNNPNPAPQNIQDVDLLRAFHNCFQGQNSDLNQVSFSVHYKNSEVIRKKLLCATLLQFSRQITRQSVDLESIRAHSRIAFTSEFHSNFLQPYITPTSLPQASPLNWPVS